MKKRSSCTWLAVTAVLVAAYLAYLATAFYEGKDEARLLEAVKSAYVDGQTPINLKMLFPELPWTRVCAIRINSSIPPGLSTADVAEWLAVDVAAYPESVPSILYQENAHLIPRPTIQFVVFFIQGDQIVKTLAIHRPFIRERENYVYLTTADDKRQCASAESAVLRFEGEGSSYQRYTFLKGTSP